jgi:hypothetical protein
VDHVQEGDAMMKKNLLLCVFMVSDLLAEPYKAVFDLSSSDYRFIMDSIALQQKGYSGIYFVR